MEVCVCGGGGVREVGGQSAAASIHPRLGCVTTAWMARWGLAFPPHSVGSAPAWAHGAAWLVRLKRPDVHAVRAEVLRVLPALRLAGVLRSPPSGDVCGVGVGVGVGVLCGVVCVRECVCVSVCKQSPGPSPEAVGCGGHYPLIPILVR